MICRDCLYYRDTLLTSKSGLPKRVIRVCSFIDYGRGDATGYVELDRSMNVIECKRRASISHWIDCRKCWYWGISLQKVTRDYPAK